MRSWAKRLIVQNARVLNVGSGSKRLVPGVLNIDLFGDSFVDIIGDARSLPIRTDSLDAIVCSAMLEHTPYPALVINEIMRCLKPGGEIYLEVPFLQPVHMIETGDYWRYTREGLIKEASCFELVESGPCIGPFSVLAWYLRKFPTIFFRSSNIKYMLEFFFGWMTFWIKYFDFFVSNATNLDVINGGVFFLGRKK